MSEGLEFIRRLEAVRRERSGEIVERRNVKCEVCGDNIPRYIGYEKGIMCSGCSETNRESQDRGNMTPGDWSGAEDYEVTGEP